MKSANFTRKQIGVIFANAKKGALSVKNGTFNFLYGLVGAADYDDSGRIETANMYVREILDCIFSGRIEKAQSEINNMQEELASWIE